VLAAVELVIDVGRRERNRSAKMTTAMNAAGTIGMCCPLCSWKYTYAVVNATAP